MPLKQVPQFFGSANEVVLTGRTIWLLAGIEHYWSSGSAPTCQHTVSRRVSLIFSVGGVPRILISNALLILVLSAVSLLAGTAISKLTEILEGRAILIRFVPLLLFAVALSVPDPVG